MVRMILYCFLSALCSVLLQAKQYTYISNWTIALMLTASLHEISGNNDIQVSIHVVRQCGFLVYYFLRLGT